MVATDPPDLSGDGRSAGAGPDAAGAATTPSASSGGSSRTNHPPATGADGNGSKAGGAPAAPSDPNSFDVSGLSGLLGVGQGVVLADPAGPAAQGSSPVELEAALAGHDHHSSSSSTVLLALTVLILLGLAGGVAVRWWAGRPGRYWPA